MNKTGMREIKEKKKGKQVFCNSLTGPKYGKLFVHTKTLNLGFLKNTVGKILGPEISLWAFLLMSCYLIIHYSMLLYVNFTKGPLCHYHIYSIFNFIL